MRGGLSVTDYLKVISVQELTPRRPGTPGAGHHHAGARRRPGSPRPIRGGPRSDDGRCSHAPRSAVRGAIRRASSHAAAQRRHQTAPAVGHGALLAAHRRPRRQTPPRFQREHRRLLAARHRRPARRPRPPPTRRLPRIRRSQASHRRLLPRRARAVRLHQRHRRSHPGLHQHLRRRRPGSAAAQARLRHVPLLRRSGRRQHSAKSTTRSPAWSSRSQAVARRHHARNPRRHPRQSQQSHRHRRLAARHRAHPAPRPQGRGAGRRSLLRILRRHRPHRNRARPQPLRLPHVLQGLRHGGHAPGLPVLAPGQHRSTCTRRSRPTA